MIKVARARRPFVYLRHGKLKVRVKESREASVIEEFDSALENAWMCPGVWCIRWRQSRTVSSMSFRPIILTATHIV